MIMRVIQGRVARLGMLLIRALLLQYGHVRKLTTCRRVIQAFNTLVLRSIRLVLADAAGFAKLQKYAYDGFLAVFGRSERATTREVPLIALIPSG